jgi:hypothetical protein
MDVLERKAYETPGSLAVMQPLQVRENRATFGPLGIYNPQVERAGDIDIADAPFGMDDRIEHQLLSPLIWRKEMQHSIDDHCFFAAKISLCLIGSRIFRATRLRVRYPDFGHNYGVIWVLLSGSVLVPGCASWGSCEELALKMNLLL